MNKLIDRVKAILVSPKPTWEVIKSEPATVKQLYMEYLVPLAAIPAVAMFIGNSLIGVHAGIFGAYRVPLVTGLVSAVLTYVLTLVGVFVAAKVIDILAPTFGATRNELNAFKVAAYTMTPALVAGVLHIIPALGVLVALAALYGIYLLYLGLQSLMNCPPEKAVGYTVVSILVMAAVYIVIGVIVAAVLGTGMSMHGMGSARYGGGDTSTAARIANATLAQHGVRANVSADNNQITVETNEGKATLNTGASAAIPANFPKDVYVYAGASVQTALTIPTGWNLMLLTPDSADKVRSTVKAKMADNGWKEVMSQAEAGGQSMVAYQKAGRNATMVVAPADKATQITLTVVQEGDASGAAGGE